MTDHYNRPDREELRRKLRRDLTAPERLLWSRLRNSQLGGARFRRQHSIGPYIVDFYCRAAKLVIEVDGPTHAVNDETEAYDAARQEYLEGFGLTVVGFTNTEVGGELDWVVERIAEIVMERGGDGADEAPPETPLCPPLE